jgi:hypothetical protein
MNPAFEIVEQNAAHHPSQWLVKATWSDGKVRRIRGFSSREVAVEWIEKGSKRTCTIYKSPGVRFESASGDAYFAGQKSIRRPNYSKRAIPDAVHRTRLASFAAWLKENPQRFETMPSRPRLHAGVFSRAALIIS